jgi:succinate-semialdehyde dehydrogenase / glutarate-semialdehyde dehydrogenase
MIQSKSPYNQEVFKTYDPISDHELSGKIIQTNAAFRSLKHTSFEDRAQWMEDAANLLEKDKEYYGQLITLEMGKLLRESIAEIEKCAWVCRYYAQHARTFMQDEPVETDGTSSLITYQPLGPILAVMPWNFPFWQVFRFAAPALMAGNTGILKHASNVPRCALAIQDIFERAGFPAGSLNSVLIESQRVEKVIAHPVIRAVTLTGSGPAGASVATIAGKYLKKTVLELGGSDPYIVLQDADLDEAVPVCVAARMLNTGQSCIAGKRFIVHEDLFEEFVGRFTKLLGGYSYGDPLDITTTLAPMASLHLRQELHNQVTSAVEHGAEIVCGGIIPPEQSGAFYPPTILINVHQDNPAYTEELFGPVAVILKAASEKEAIDIANATNFGLGASIFSQDVQHAEELAKSSIEAGSCFVNAQVKSDPRLPFGGIKHSGFGRELSRHGLREFTNIKTIYVK